MNPQLSDWLIGTHGGGWIYWIKNKTTIGKFIETNAIKPATIKLEAPVEGLARGLKDLGIAGGIRVSHLHFDDRIYMLNNEQWNKFSAGIIAEANASLSKVKTIGFEEGLMLGTAAKMLGK